MPKDVNVLALVKGKERYIFLFTDENADEALRVLGRFACNQELSFTWYDAAVLSQKIREANKKRIEQKNNTKFSLPLPPPFPPAT